MAKYTDEQIKKAMRQCWGISGTGKCKGCLYENDHDACLHKLPMFLDLINRQEAELERLKKGIEVDLEFYATEYDSKIKSEAIKAFAEKVKQESAYCSAKTDELIIFETVFDSLVKEMVGESNDENLL